MCDSCDWEDVLEELEDLCSDSDYDFANDTLESIAEWAREKKHITEKQVAAIDNIKRAVERRG